MIGLDTWCLMNILALSIDVTCYTGVTQYPDISMVMANDRDINPEITLLEPEGIRFAIRENTNNTIVFCIFMNVNKPLNAKPPYHDMYCQYFGYVFNIFPRVDLVWTCTAYSPRFGDIIYYSLKIVDEESVLYSKYNLNMTILRDENDKLSLVYGLAYSNYTSLIFGTDE